MMATLTDAEGGPSPWIARFHLDTPISISRRSTLQLVPSNELSSPLTTFI